MTEFAIIGIQRSGTTVLSEFLNSHPMIFAAGEIFHPGATGIHSYNKFLEKIGDVKRPQIGLGSRLSSFCAFVEFLRSQTEKKHIGYNVKYSSLHHLDGDWRALSGPPTMLRVFRDRNVKIIHVVRRSLFNASLSALVAEQTGVWHKRSHESYSPLRIFVDPTRLINNIKLAAEELRSFRNYTRDFSDMIQIEYEEMFEYERFSDATTARLSDVFGVPDLFIRQPALERLSKISYETVVANFGDIIDQVRASGVDRNEL